VTPRTEVAGARSGGVVRFRAGGRHITVDVSHLFVLLSIEAFCGWYLLDARASSTDIENLLLIQPAAILAFVVAIFILREVITISPVPGIVAPRPRLPSATMVKILGSMAMLGGYVGAMSFLGFDIATAAYVCGSLLVLGERRVAVLVIAPILFSAVTIFAFRQVVSIPLPLFFGFFG
jgi:hypothetical protein